MENKVRIGKDFTIRWAIVTSEGEPYAVNKEAAILRVYSPYGAKDAAGFKVAGNVIEWVFKGKDQKHLGDYTIELVENNGQDGMLSVDSVDAFTLVAHTEQESLNAEGAVEVQTIELTSQIALAPIVEQGAPPYDDTELRTELARLENEKADKQELAELSEEVSGLSEKVDELGQPIFKAIYGETKIEEIIAAYESGKVVHCDFNGLCYTLARISNGEAFFTANIGMITYRLYCSADGIWTPQTYNSEQTDNKVTSLSSASTDTQYPSAKAVYDATQKMMPATPSGDPMHYIYEKAGAEYNDTGADIVRTGIHGGTIVWKAGCWWLNELGDIDNEEMQNLYTYRYTSPSGNQLSGYFQAFKKTRTPMINVPARATSLNAQYFAFSTSFETIALSQDKDMLVYLNNLVGFAGYSSVKKIVNGLDLTHLKNANSINDAFYRATKLQEVKLYYLQVSVQFGQSPLLSNASILYMIQNEAATSAIVITLHADAYARAMADAEITAALAAHPNVSLASA